jgi:hypothetical protein
LNIALKMFVHCLWLRRTSKGRNQLTKKDETGIGRSGKFG